MEWSDLIDRGTHRFEPAAEPRTLSGRAGVALDRPTVTRCQSGGRAAVMAFGPELVGAAGVSNYYRSWLEAGAAGVTQGVPFAEPPNRRPRALLLATGRWPNAAAR